MTTAQRARIPGALAVGCAMLLACGGSSKDSLPTLDRRFDGTWRGTVTYGFTVTGGSNTTVVVPNQQIRVSWAEGTASVSPICPGGSSQAGAEFRGSGDYAELDGSASCPTPPQLCGGGASVVIDNGAIELRADGSIRVAAGGSGRACGGSGGLHLEFVGTK